MSYDYNVRSEVKYWTIEKELMEKHSNETTVYNQSDIIQACNELYRMELSRAFNATDLPSESKMDRLYDHLAAHHLGELNRRIQQISDELAHQDALQLVLSNTGNSAREKYSRMLFCCLFQYKYFHLTHQWLQQLI